MAKLKKDYSRLSIKNLPVRKATKRIELNYKKNVIAPVSFRLRPNIKKMLNEMTRTIQIASPMKFSNTDVLELIIMHAYQQPVEKLLKMPVER